jgi:preprotein translocase subunit SecA
MWEERRTYKSLIKKKKRLAISKLHTELMEFKIKNPQEFWRKIQEESSTEIPISLEEVKAYFMTLLDSPKNNGNLNENDMLDQPITEEEVTAAVRALKKNKAPGGDGLLPEIFKCFNSNFLINSFTTALFNKLLEQEV